MAQEKGLKSNAHLPKIAAPRQKALEEHSTIISKPETFGNG
jgi:hypothetical protein